MRSTLVHRRFGDLGVEAREDDDDARARVGELVVELADRVQGIRWNDDRARLEAAEERVDELRAVREDDGDAVAFLHPEPLEARGEAVGELVEMSVRHRRVDAAISHSPAKYGRNGLRVLAGGAFEQGVECQAGVRQMA